jgi:iron-sulfur cluster assembly protein
MLTITKKATTQLLLIANNNNVKNLLFYVKGGGCNGFNYQLKPTTNKPGKLDEVVNINNNINIIIDSKSVFYLLGTTIDWKKDIMGESFHFENPNAKSKCGCGTTFSI